jgi:hypothetical protein
MFEEWSLARPGDETKCEFARGAFAPGRFAPLGTNTSVRCRSPFWLEARREKAYAAGRNAGRKAHPGDALDFRFIGSHFFK